MKYNVEEDERVIKARRALEQKKAMYERAKKAASAERRKKENRHKYMMGGCVVKYFPECYNFDEEAMNKIIKAGLESFPCQEMIKKLKQGDVSTEVKAESEVIQNDMAFNGYGNYSRTI